MLNKLEISNMLTISTIHISESTVELLSSGIMNLPVYEKSTYGWFMYVEVANEEGIDHLPKDLQDILKLAIENNCTWVCLDCDGPEVDQLEYRQF